MLALSPRNNVSTQFCVVVSDNLCFLKLGGQRPRLGRSFGQHHKVVRSRAAPARLVGGGSGFFGLEGVLW